MASHGHLDDERPAGEPYESPWALDPVPTEYKLPPEKPAWDNADEIDIDLRTPLRKRESSLWLLAVLAGLVLFATIVLWILTRDAEPVWDNDLVADHASVPSGEARPRAAERLRVALDATANLGPVQGPPGLPPALWNTQALAKEALRFKPIVDQVRDMVPETDWSQNNPAWVEEDLGNHSAWPNLTLACMVTSIYQTRQQQGAAAVSLGLDLLTLGQRFQTVTVLPSYYARAIDLHRAGCIALSTVLQGSQMSPDDLANAQQDMESCAPLDKTLQKAMGSYYRYEKELIVGALSSDKADELVAAMMPNKPGRLFFKPQATLGLMADSFRELRGEVIKPSYSRSTSQLAARVGFPGRPRAIPGHPNFSGIRHANQRLWPYVDLMESQTLARARHELVRTFFAIRRFMAIKGRMPASLESVVADKLLTALPIDPFTGLPLRYNPGDQVLYSVGSDHRDDGGNGSGQHLEDDLEPALLLDGM